MDFRAVMLHGTKPVVVVLGRAAYEVGLSSTWDLKSYRVPMVEVGDQCVLSSYGAAAQARGLYTVSRRRFLLRHVTRATNATELECVVWSDGKRRVL